MKKLLLIIPLLIWVACEDDSVDLNARVTHTGPDIIVYNNDNFDWREVKLELNDEYIVKINVIPAGSSKTISVRNFTTEKDGRRFINNTHRLKRFWIAVKLKGGKRGYYLGNWN